jgi:diguanylate cyclase (GGDEF)-like protein
VTDTVPNEHVQDALNAWLSPARGSLAQRFPPPLEARYEADTGRQRSRMGGLIWLSGTVVMLVLWLTLGGVPAANQAANQMVFLDTVIPFCGLMGLVLLTDPPPARREAALAMPAIAIGAAMWLMFHHSRQNDAELNSASTLLLLVFAGVVLQLRFGAMLAFSLLLLCGFIAGMIDAVALAPAYRLNLCLLCAASTGFVLVANWRLQADHRHFYALNLREKLRHDDLSLRNQTLDALVRSDALTGLANRRAYDAWLQNCWLQARESGNVVGLIVLDIDRFKAYNDCNGHAAGDICLQTISRCLRDQLRGTSDLVARLGGEEFAVLLPGLQTQTCGDIAERLRQAVVMLDLPHLGVGGVVTLSCGAASLPARDPYCPADLFAAADAALYRAKQSGRDQVCLAELAQALSASCPSALPEGVRRAATNPG